MEQDKLTAARARSKLAARSLAIFAGLWVLGMFVGGLRTNGSILLAGVSFVMTLVSLWYVVRADKEVARLERAARAQGESGG